MTHAKIVAFGLFIAATASAQDPEWTFTRKNCQSQFHELAKTHRDSEPSTLSDDQTRMFYKCNGAPDSHINRYALYEYVKIPHYVAGDPDRPSTKATPRFSDTIEQFFNKKYGDRTCAEWRGSQWRHVSCSADLSGAQVHVLHTGEGTGLEITVEQVIGVVVSRPNYWEHLHFVFAFEVDRPPVQDMDAGRGLHMVLDGQYTPISGHTPPSQYSHSLDTDYQGELTSYFKRIESELQAYLENP